MKDSGPEALGALLDQFGCCLDGESSRRIAEFRISPDIQQHLEKVADGANEGTLTSDELAEYEALIDAADFISILKLRARRNIGLDAA